MLLCAILAIIVAERCAQAFAPRLWAFLRSLGVRWRLEPMLVKGFQDIVVGAMVQLLNCWFLQMLCGQILSVLVVTPGQSLVVDGLDADNSWGSIVKGS
jgi:hypothetical protein